MTPAAKKRFLIPVVLAALGVALTFLADATDDLMAFIGIALIGAAGVVAMALVFLEVGHSEDRERRRGGS